MFHWKKNIPQHITCNYLLLGKICNLLGIKGSLHHLHNSPQYSPSNNQYRCKRYSGRSWSIWHMYSCYLKSNWNHTPGRSKHQGIDSILCDGLSTSYRLGHQGKNQANIEYIHQNQYKLHILLKYHKICKLGHSDNILRNNRDILLSFCRQRTLQVLLCIKSMNQCFGRCRLDILGRIFDTSRYSHFNFQQQSNCCHSWNEHLQRKIWNLFK